MTPFKSIGLIFSIALLCGCDRSGESAGTPASPAVGSKSADASHSFAALEPAGAGALVVPCAIDKINAQPAAGRVVNVEAGRDIHLTGWISDAAKQVPAKFTIVLSGPATYGVDAVAGISRPDVARALGSPALAKAGFNVSATLGSVAVGKYAVQILEDANGKPARCTTNTHVEVVNPAG
jgi:hypothetical protein